MIFFYDIMCPECETMNRKQTSKQVATKASKILKSNKSSRNTKSVAASALSQARK